MKWKMSIGQVIIAMLVVGGFLVLSGVLAYHFVDNDGLLEKHKDVLLVIITAWVSNSSAVILWLFRRNAVTEDTKAPEE